MKLQASLAALLLLLMPAASRGAARDHRSAEETAPATVSEIAPQTAVLLLDHPVTSFRSGLAEARDVMRTTGLFFHASGSPLSALRELPLIGAVQRRMGERFNTSESSHIDAFAVCYHLSDRVGFQVIPGNPAPPRMGASVLQNNAGVTVGMTLRLKRQR